ncbi:hypothetical protein Cantr_03700 [Candida viswanathii]|uniref:Glyoxylate reductase 1 n=1 Tax=Candida viswanathii TaxID=5486 RepID=A0A367XMQ3_9ASCO|nr:hypothetical protein Cantr_03700 [Candida viswanathii]
MTIKQKVLFLERPQVEQLAEFESKFECIYYQLTSLEQTIADFQTKLADIVAIYCGWAGFAPIGGFRGKLLNYAPPSLRIITTCSIGYDVFDAEGLAERGVVLTNVPSPMACEAVADLVLYNTINSFRNIKFYERFAGSDHFNHTGILRTSLLHGKFDQESGTPLVEPLFGSSYGYACCRRENLSPRGHNAVIVGFGNIGELIGARLACIGMNVHYVKRTKLSEAREKELGYKVTYHSSLEETVGFADLIIVACPGSPSTRHLINGELIEKMEKPFRIINIGRGFVIDEDALVEGLKKGKVLFAGLDVFEREPTIHPELVNRQDVVLTPHIGSGIAENYKYTAVVCMENIETVMFGYQKPLTRVN